MDLKTNPDASWLEAQYSVLGSVLISPEVAPQVMEGTSERDYYGPCRTIFNAIRKLFIQGIDIDPVSVNDALGGSYRDFILQLMEVTPTAANIDRYITLCREQAQTNGLRELARRMAEESDSVELKKLFAQANSLMISKPKMKIINMAQAMAEFMEDQQKPTDYLTWPIQELNSVLYAEPGDFVVVGGFPSAGKTAFALQCLWHFAKKQKVGFFSLETNSKKLFARQVASICSVSMRDIKEHSIDQRSWDRICAMSSHITKTDIEFLNAAGCTVEDIRATTLMRGYKVIFIDYLQLIQSGGLNRTEQVTAVSIALHTMAQSLGVTIIALSQLRRSPNELRNRLPDMSSLRESGQIEQDADIVLLLSLKDANDRDGLRILQIAKNKDGTRPDMILNFDGARQTFRKATELEQAVEQVQTIKGKIKPGKAKADAADDDSGFWVQDSMEALSDDTPVPFQ